MSFSVFIPARHDATRLPGKPLADIAGRPLIQWVYEAACRSDARRVVIATDDERVVSAASGFGAEVVMTGRHHASGTDRICEAAGKAGSGDDELIVNLQGDEPEMPAALIRSVARALADDDQASIATAAHPAGETERDDPNVVKVVCDRRGYALYFSRSRIPFPRQPQAAAVTWRHLGIYAYRYGYLKRFTGREPTPAERSECLEQLRALEYGDRIVVHLSDDATPPGIDTPGDLERFRRKMADG